MTVKKTSVALGSFDGLHKGHKSVIACALNEKERGLEPVVMLFDSHPLLTLNGNPPKEILQSNLREEMINSMGAKVEYISFKEISNMTPSDFFEEILLNQLNAGAISCGENYCFGKNHSGNTETLKTLCNMHNIKLNILPLTEFNSFPVSSTAIREAISKGNIKEANVMLGYDFRYKNKVMHGAKRGRVMGAPTINQYFDNGFIIPAVGTYASYTIVEGKEYPSVTNIGLRPTFENEDLRSETYIIGFDGDLYDKEIEVRLLDFIRTEKRFDSMEELKKQINSDREISELKFKQRGEANV